MSEDDANNTIDIADPPAKITDATETIVLPPLTREILDRIQRGEIPTG